jgi:O-antigen biosynthesis protein
VSAVCAPRVSIVIATLGNDRLERCLESIRADVGTRLASEIVVVANAPLRPERLARLTAHPLPPVRVISTGVNLGFGAASNLGARSSRGEYLIFVNDDVEVLPGWLDALVQTADSHPHAGAVGSLMLFPDGTIQDAGAIVWSDGSTLGVDRGTTPGSSRYNFLRPVDYCSACSLLVRRHLWDAVGGFDDRYFPGYYEDVDLCFSLARLGYTTLFQPRSRAVHHESCSSTSVRKEFLVLRHRELFKHKWAAELAHSDAPAPCDPRAIARAVDRRGRRRASRLLLIDDRPPQRASGSGFSVLLDAIDEIGGDGYAISVAVSDRLDGDLDRLGDMGVHVSRQAPDAVLQDRTHLYDAVVISRPHNFARYASAVRTWQPQARLIYLAESLFYRRICRELELVSDPAQQARRWREMLDMREVERAIARRADRIVCVSAEERDVLQAVEGSCPIDVIRPVARGIAPTDTSFSERSDLLFTPAWLAGDASPNVDALRWFAAAVLPRLTEAQPAIRLRVTGADPPPAARAVAHPAVDFVGFVPNLADAYAAARVVVVPMRFGAGIKIKYLETLQHAVPVVATSVGAEGLAMADKRGVIVADDPETFAGHVLRLYGDEQAWNAQRRQICRVLHRWQTDPGRTWRQTLAASILENRDDPPSHA